MSNVNNLISLKDRPLEERIAIALKGNLKSQEVRRKKKKLKKEIEDKLNEIILIDKNKAMTRQEFLVDKLFKLLDKEENIAVIIKTIEILNNLQKEDKIDLEKRKRARLSKIARYQCKVFLKEDLENLTDEELQQLAIKWEDKLFELMRKYYSNVFEIEDEEEFKNKVMEIFEEILIIDENNDNELNKELSNYFKEEVMMMNLKKMIPLEEDI